MEPVRLLYNGASQATVQWNQSGYCTMEPVRLLYNGASQATVQWNQSGYYTMEPVRQIIASTSHRRSSRGTWTHTGSKPSYCHGDTYEFLIVYMSFLTIVDQLDWFISKEVFSYLCEDVLILVKHLKEPKLCHFNPCYNIYLRKTIALCETQKECTLWIPRCLKL